jgi:hypothetical protein
MFPRLKDRLGAALDLVVEFSTLGEYRLGTALAPKPADAPPAVASRVRGPGGALEGVTPALYGVTPSAHPSLAAHEIGCVPADRRIAAGGAAGVSEGVGAEPAAPSAVATPAARRRPRCGCGRAERGGPRERRDAPPAPEQTCVHGEGL